SPADVAATLGHSYHRPADTAIGFMREEIEQFMHHLHAERHASPHTLRSYRSDLEKLCEFLVNGKRQQKVDVARVSIEDLRAFAPAKLRDCRRSTVSRKVAAIRGFFSFLLSSGKIRRNPATQLGAPKVEKRLPVFLPIDDAERLLNGMPRGMAWA